ncbi:histidine kinase [Aureimonas ureilytica]|uniref:histidine kinase n=1 Tax=Aureimonas ureilytica TaxID=401562 RepID=A0A175RS80_9HYPH|nr:PAS domain-containing hybrid sensor histidine kinase/response regulator [Aureimonas ureilytica]KTQ98574.1 histidine kinase [Aureimonas ureilytica]KTR05682.1 histidine kinase [Aureimonas ureilytica]
MSVLDGDARDRRRLDTNPGETEDAERVQLALAAGAIIGTWFWDLPSDRFTIDEQFAQAFGIDPSRGRQGLSLQQVIETVHPEDKPGVIVAIEDVIARGGAYAHQYRVRRMDGRYYWIEANGRVDRAPDGTPLRFPGVLLDIEGRRALEAERDRATALLRSFIEAVPGVVYAKDRDGRILMANRGTTELIGKAPDAYLGRNEFEYFDDQAMAARLRATDQGVMERGEREETEEEIRRPDGTPSVWLSTKAPLRDEMGAVVGLVSTALDITERKAVERQNQALNELLETRMADAIAERERAEDALRQSHKMEAVGQLTGGLAHDFNNLLAGITGSLEMLQTRVAQGRLNDLERYITGAQGAAKRAAALTHRLLAFSRRQTLDPKPTDVNRLVSDMEELIRRTVGPHIRVATEAQADLWPTFVDSNQLENALLNLCINARDAMPDGGQITIETDNCHMDERAARERDLEPGEYVSLCVSDTGTGMTADVIERAFDPFFTTKPIGVGTGLGLSMIYGFARQSGGQVRIDSVPGQGTRVCIHLPRHDADAAQPEANVQLEATGRAEAGTTVLVIDDEPIVRMLVVDVLEDLGYTTIEAGDGPQGMKVIASDARIDLLITDVGLPNGMNGRQVADAARALRPQLKVLFVTGYAESAVLSHGHLEPGMQVVTKPFDIAVLTNRIERMIADG